ncbi:MAG: hypothetical protein D6721_10145 [Gammaproteobacteria bacterium]|nr:MAG: hypothetical protein D6721_10145 [Gammaproteobacteria bacterium]
MSPEEAKQALLEAADRASLARRVREHPRESLLAAFLAGLVTGLGDRRDRVVPLVVETLLRAGLDREG